MTQYPGIVKRAEVIAWRSGKIYATPDGTLFKTLFTLSTLSMIYTFFINLFYILGNLMIYQDTPNFKEVLTPIIAVSVATALLVVSFVLGKLKKRILSCAILVVVSSFLIVFFGSISKAELPDNDFLGFKPLFFWRHFIPLFLIFVVACWMITIVLRAKRNFNKFYKDCEEQLYTLYKKNHPDAGEEEWIEFAKAYDGSSPQKLFQKNKKDKSAKTNTSQDIDE